MVKELVSLESDILCLQEVDRFSEHFSPQLQFVGYNSIYAQRGPKKKEGCAVFYKEDRFVVLDSHVERFNSLAQDSKRAGSLSDDYKTDNIALFVLLRVKNGSEASPSSYPPSLSSQRPVDWSRTICVATTHIFWDPQYPHVKLHQSAQLLSAITKYLTSCGASSPQDVPLILAGDFNSMPDSSVYKLIMSGKVQDEHYPPHGVREERRRQSETVAKKESPRSVDASAPASSSPSSSSSEQQSPRELEEFSHDLSFASAYCVEGTEPKYTNYTANFRETIDYIFYSPHFELVSILDLPDVDHLPGLPHEALCSDHLSLRATFALPPSFQ